MKNKQTYGQMWDGYVAESFPKLQKDAPDLAFPGDEWGTESSWKKIFDKLFVPAGVSSWEAAIEIGGGGGKYTERVLSANTSSRLFGFDVSVNFLEATGKRLAHHVDSGRLSLHEIDSLNPGAMSDVLTKLGYARKVDAMFSIDAMVHVDLQYLVCYWMNAALMLKPGGRILMTLADPTTISGFQKIIRDIRKFYKFQGRICPKFEYLSKEIVNHVMLELGFEIEFLEPWSYHEGRPPRDLYLSAKLVDTSNEAKFRSMLVSAGETTDSHYETENPETYSDLWNRISSEVSAGKNADRPSADVVVDRLLWDLGLGDWSHLVEIGGGDGRYTAAMLAANSKLKVTGIDVSAGLMSVAAARLKQHVDLKALEYLKIDPVHPDALITEFERRGLNRKVDAFVSVDAMLHVDLQYQMVYYINAANLLREGGYLVVQVPDASSSEGVKRLLADVQRFFPLQGQCSTRFEWQSPHIMREVLSNLGFDVLRIARASEWGSETGDRDMFVVAKLVRPKQAEALRMHVSIGLPVIRMVSGSMQNQPEDESMNEDDVSTEIAKSLGQAYWRQLTIQANPDLTKEQLREMLKEQWGGNKREYTKLGRMVKKQMENMGFEIVKKVK